LELGGEPGLAQRGDGLPPQPLDLLLRAALPAGLLLRHRGHRLRTAGRRCVHIEAVIDEAASDRARAFAAGRLPAVRRLVLVVLAAWPACALALGGAAPAPAADPAPPAGPGGSVGWTPTGRQALGRAVLYTGSANGAFVAWMDPQLTKLAVVPGTGDP